MWKKIAKIILSVFIIFFIIGGISVALIIQHYKKEIPNISTLVENYTPSIPTKIYDRNGELIDIIYKESRTPVKFENIPKNIKNAFLAIEDRRFYSHFGIDPLGLARAIFVNLLSGSKKQGASSFTQQLSRNAFLSHEKKFSRKVKEAIITIEIEKRYTKNEIFEKYLNEIYFGEGAYGIKNVAKSLFHKNLKDLTLIESAMLAGMPNRPSTYNPRKHLNYSIKRAHIVLAQMLKYGMITQKEYEDALKFKFVLERDFPKNYDFSKNSQENSLVIYNKGVVNKSKVPSFTDTVQKILLNKFDEEIVYNGGLKVYTTLDFKIQKVAENIFKTYKPFVDDEKLQGAMVTLDTSNGHVISIVGGRDFKAGNFNRAIYAKRQLGSSFKPFIYLTSLSNGKSENTIVEDSRVIFGNWAPKNVGTLYRKNSTLLEGLDKSVNMVAIKLLKDIGHKSLKETIKKTGINIVPPHNLTAALGSVSGTALELAQAYSIFSNSGYSVEPIFLLEVQDNNGNTLYKSSTKLEKTFHTEDIAVTTNLLISSTKTGTSHNSTVITKDGKQIQQGGKTGTTNDSRTVWYAGFTPDLVTTIYLGYDDNSKMSNATGGGLAAPIWKRFYTEIIDENLYHPKKFDYIDNLLKNGELYYQVLNQFSGLITSKNGKIFLMRENRVELEYDKKYNKRSIRSILYDTYDD